MFIKCQLHVRCYSKKLISINAFFSLQNPHCTDEKGKKEYKSKNLAQTAIKGRTGM